MLCPVTHLVIATAALALAVAASNSPAGMKIASNKIVTGGEETETVTDETVRSLY